MKRFVLVAVFLLFLAPGAQACVGRILTVGAVDTPAGRVMSEMLALMINERTGTTVRTAFFADAEKLYEGISAGEIGLLVEDAAQGLARLGKTPDGTAADSYQMVKELHRTELAMVWLDPFAYTVEINGASVASAVVLTQSVMTDFPGLPRLLNKLAKKIGDADYQSMLKQAEGGEKSHRIARDMLEAKKLI